MDKVLNLLGLAYVARKVVLGEDVLNNFKKIKLVIFASDISDKSRERVLKKCEYYNLEYIDKYSSEQLSKALGKNLIKLIGITDKGFADSLYKKYKE